MDNHRCYLLRSSIVPVDLDKLYSAFASIDSDGLLLRLRGEDRDLKLLISFGDPDVNAETIWTDIEAALTTAGIRFSNQFPDAIDFPEHY